MKLTWIDLNSWIFQLAGKTILVDPWLVDPMVFYGQPWLFTAYHKALPAFTPETLPPVDLILLSQGVDDHCHVPTLKQLDRAIPVIASPTAAKIVNQLGFQQVTALSHWQEITLDHLKIQAVVGAEIQPGQVENGVLLTDCATGKTLYYEPHSFPVQEAHRIGQVDVAIAPVIGQNFPLLGQVIMGPEQAIELVQTLHPKVFLPTTRGDIRTHGILPMLIKSVGSVEEFRDRLTASHAETKLIVPNPGEAVEIN
ncbi:MAG: MBL fold metallo-hydrolase [Oscillatoriales cyanobacterium C42_A2020_001]|nr:MBL fold metallo-hydrolase [Leptolyngbyaceae cyanobacterium C42_A2020_001]